MKKRGAIPRFFLFVNFTYIRYVKQILHKLAQIKMPKLSSINSFFIVIILVYLGFQSSNQQDMQKYILENPEVLMQSVNNYHEEQKKKQQENASDIIKQSADKVYKNPNDARIIKGTGKIKLVEFYDYSCGYCKKMSATVEQALNDYNDIEVIYKEMPILGPRSTMLAAASSTFYQMKPGKFLEFHKALFNLGNNISVDSIADFAQQYGADKHLFSEKINRILSDKKHYESNIRLAMSLGIQATPVTIVNNKLIPGYLNYDQFKNIIDSQYAN